MEEEVLGKAYDGRLMRRLLTYMKPYRVAVAVSLVMLLLNSLVQLAGPLLTKLAIDRYLVPATHPSRTPLDAFLSRDPWTGITQLTALYLVAIALGFLFDFAQTYLLQIKGQRAMFDLRRELMSHLQTLDVAFFDHHPVGRLVTRATTDVDVRND